MTELGFPGWTFKEEEIKPPLIHTINPSAGWTKDFECYYLIVDLPDFKQDEVEVIVDPLGSLVIKGLRQSGENEYVRFERHFKLPEDLDMTKTVTSKLQNDILYVTVCRKLVEEDKWEFKSSPKEETRGEQHENKDAEGEKETKSESREESADDKKAGDEGRKEHDAPKTILEKIEHHRCIWVGILAFAFGVFVASHKLRQPPPR